MSENEGIETVTGTPMAEPVVTDRDDVGVLFTYTDFLDGSSHSTLATTPGRYVLVRVPHDEKSREKADETTVTGSPIREAYVDEESDTGVEVTHLQLRHEEASTRQFTAPGVYKLLRTLDDN